MPVLFRGNQHRCAAIGQPRNFQTVRHRRQVQVNASGQRGNAPDECLGEIAPPGAVATQRCPLLAGSPEPVNTWENGRLPAVAQSHIFPLNPKIRITIHRSFCKTKANRRFVSPQVGLTGSFEAVKLTVLNRRLLCRSSLFQVQGEVQVTQLRFLHFAR